MIRTLRHRKSRLMGARLFYIEAEWAKLRREEKF